MAKLILTTCVLMFTTVASAMAGMFDLGTLQIRATAPGMAVTGGYITITNRGHMDDRLVAASAEFAKRVEIHEMIHDNGVMKMRQRSGGIELRAGETVFLKPGGLHLMFMGLSETMAPGEMRDVTLEFGSGHVVTVPAMVLRPAEISIEGGHGHSHSGHNHSGGTASGHTKD